MMKIKKASAKEYERCVLCGKSSDYAKETPVDQRVGYIEGAGQLCRECYQSVYPKGEGGHV